MKIYEYISCANPKCFLLGDCLTNPSEEEINELIEELKFTFNKLNDVDKLNTINEIRVYELDDAISINDDDDLMTYVYGADYNIILKL